MVRSISSFAGDLQRFTQHIGDRSRPAGRCGLRPEAGRVKPADEAITVRVETKAITLWSAFPQERVLRKITAFEGRAIRSVAASQRVAAPLALARRMGRTDRESSHTRDDRWWQYVRGLLLLNIVKDSAATCCGACSALFSFGNGVCGNAFNAVGVKGAGLTRSCSRASSVKWSGRNLLVPLARRRANWPEKIFVKRRRDVVWRTCAGCKGQKATGQ